MTTTTDSLCGASIASRRAFLAFLWSCVTIMTVVAFMSALVFSIMAKNEDDDDEYYNNYNQNDGSGSQDEQQQERDVEVAVTSRAMAFAAMWTAVLAAIMSVFGTVILGFQSPTGEYYTCCSPSVHRTTPLGLGAFIGALLMFANVTLICSILFGEFKVRDYYARDGEDQGENEEGEEQGGYEGYAATNDTALQRSSMAFSITCMFLTIIYLGFAALTYVMSTSVLEEADADARVEALGGTHHRNNMSGHNGYIDGRFDVRPKKRDSTTSGGGGGGFVSPPRPPVPSTTIQNVIEPNPFADKSTYVPPHQVSGDSNKSTDVLQSHFNAGNFAVAGNSRDSSMA